MSSGFPTRTSMVRGGIPCHLSEIGQYNYWYPVRNRTCVITKDAIVDTLPWFDPSNRSLTAIKVKTTYIDGCSDLINRNKETTVVWVDSAQILKW